jgi:glycosyltransferase involved in cell wall biosynthesis
MQPADPSDLVAGETRPIHPATGLDMASKLGDVAAAAGLRAIHMLAWRDLDDPEAGGSEVHAAQVARRWAEAGIDVTMRTSFAPNRPSHGARDGYRVIRKAGRYLVFPRAVASEISGRMGPRDGLVEIWNGVPFLSPMWTRGPRMVWLHHVHGEMWRQVFTPGLAKIGAQIESRWAPPLYRKTPIVTLSPSSRDLIAERLHLDRNKISVVPPGIDAVYSPGGTKSEAPLLVAVGRLVPVKRLGRLIAGAVELRRRVPELQVVLVGDGYSRPDLEAQIADSGAEGWINLAGRLPLDQVVDLYRRAWAVTSFSGHEGWGMTLTEAAACATPSIASDIPGHRDSVVHGRTGLLGATDAELVDQLEQVLTDEKLRLQLGAGALIHAAALTWDATALGTLKVLADDARRRKHR